MPKTMSLEEYLAAHDVLFATSGWSLDKCRFPHGQTDRAKKRLEKQHVQYEEGYVNKRNAVRSEYYALVENGELIPPSKKEQLIARANGHPDNASTQAARRVCEKRGIDWTQNQEN